MFGWKGWTAEWLKVNQVGFWDDNGNECDGEGEGEAVDSCAHT